MWLERLGTVDERLFIGFGVVAGLLVILALVNVILLCLRTDHAPGRSMTSFLVYSTVVISCAVLFRGVQSHWGRLDNLQQLCPIFAALMAMGYTTYGVALMTKSWALLIVYKWNRRLKEFWVTLVAWLVVIAAGIAVIVWEAVFSPAIAESTTLSESNIYGQDVYLCEGWPPTDGTNHKQYAWRIAFSCYFAFLLLLALASVPFHFTLRLENQLASPGRIALLVVIVNATLYVVASLIVWFRLDHPVVDDSYKYAIIGSLQLWMLFVTQVSLIAAEIAVRCCLSETYSTKNQQYELGWNARSRDQKNPDDSGKRLASVSDHPPSNVIIEGYDNGAY